MICAIFHRFSQKFFLQTVIPHSTAYLVRGKVCATEWAQTENPKTIIEEIEIGAKKSKGKYVTIENRTEAIKYAIDMATKNDIIVLAGKGHETYQEINGEKYQYDEREIIKEVT